MKDDIELNEIVLDACKAKFQHLSIRKRGWLKIVKCDLGHLPLGLRSVGVFDVDGCMGRGICCAIV